MKNIVYIFPVIFFTSCAMQSAPEITPEAQSLQVVTSADNCRVIDIVVGSSDLGQEIGMDSEYAMIDAKNKAALLGADSIKIVGAEEDSSRRMLTYDGGTVILEALDCR